jgi:cell division protein FtsB
MKKLLRSPRRVIVALGACLLLFYMLFNNKGIIKRIQLERDATVMAEKVATAKEETKALIAQINALEKEKKIIERIARERYGMIREGETVYRVKKD